MTVLQCERCGSDVAGICVPGLCPACLMALAAGPPVTRNGEPDWEADPAAATMWSVSGRNGISYIGPYRILEQIGEGGMGIVYRAEQRHPIHRTVAIKVVKLGMDTPNVVARFEAEQQALALMNHVNVAKVFEAGATQDGRPYFVMEYVRGQPITSFCDDHQVPVRQRLRLLVQACEAVHHAHQKAIVHRDIKPTNLLVTADANGPMLKVIDFGVAKALSHRLTDHTLFTEQGKLIGTPEYMSPEQAELSGADVDTRTDIYSLGVVLYELLAGALPYDAQTLRNAKFDEMRRIIREQEPPRPSQRLTLDKNGAEAAKRRHTDCPSLHRMLRKELEWIPLKAMNKDPAERYRSAAELADDLRNYLEGRPLIAGPRMALYHVRKFAGKHRRAAALATGMVIVVVALVVALAVQTRRAVVARNAEAARTIQYQNEMNRALQAEWAADQRLAGKLVAIGDAQLGTGQVIAARQTYLESLDIAQGLGLPSAPLLARLYVADRGNRPIMGSYGKDQGLGGFSGSHVNCLALCPDGRSAVTADADSTLKLWDLRSGRLVQRFKGHSRSVAYVALTPDGRRMLSSSFDQIVRVWDVRSAVEQEPFTGNSGEVYTLAIHPDGRLALSGDTGGNLLLWDIATRQVLWNFQGHNGTVAMAAFSPDGGTALSGGHDGTLKLWDIPARKIIRTYLGHADQVNGLAFSADGRTAVSGSFDGTVRVWDLSRDDTGRIIGRHDKGVWRAVLSPQGAVAASAGRDQSITLWDVAAGKLIRQMAGQTGDALGLAFSRDGQLLVASGDDSALRVWDMTDDTLLSSSGNNRATGAPVYGAAVSDEGLVALGTASGTTVLFDAASRQRLATYGGHGAAVAAVGLAPDGNTILSGYGDGSISAIDLENGKETWRRPYTAGSTEQVSGMALLPGNHAIIAGPGPALRLWEPTNGGTLHALDQQSASITCLAVSGDGRFVACGGADGAAAVWDIAAASPVWRYTGTGVAVRAAAFSPDGHSILVGGDDGGVAVGDLVNNSVSGTLSCGAGVSALAFLPDGATAWSAGQDGMIRLWNVPRRQLLGTLPASTKAVTAMALSPNGQHAVCAGADGAWRVWDLSRSAARLKLEARVRQARATLDATPDDPAATAVLGEWFAFRGKDDWAAQLLERGRAGGTQVASLTLARCYWRSQRLPEALAEFQRASRQKEASPLYLGLCQRAVADSMPAVRKPGQ